MEDVTIEDEFDSNEQIFPKAQIKSVSIFFLIFEFVVQYWLIFFLLIILIFIYLFKNKFSRWNSNSTVVGENQDKCSDRYNDILRARERQQKAYEEQTLRHAQEKKEKAELLKSTENEKANKLKYRTNDHNPLTGQSTSGNSNSCSWRPSSKRRPAGG